MPSAKQWVGTEGPTLRREAEPLIRSYNEAGAFLEPSVEESARETGSTRQAQAGDAAQSRRAYENFLALWKDADPDIPILLDAKAEYARLK